MLINKYNGEITQVINRVFNAKAVMSHANRGANITLPVLIMIETTEAIDAAIINIPPLLLL
jgi:hypothetical protein